MSDEKKAQCADNALRAPCPQRTSTYDGEWVCEKEAGHTDAHVSNLHPATPKQALDGLFNAAVSGIGGVKAAALFNIVSSALQRSETAGSCECCEMAGTLNEGCVKYEHALESIRIHASGECSHTADEHIQCFTEIERLVREATGTGSEGP